jgi:hypothetical protein
MADPKRRKIRKSLRSTFLKLIQIVSQKIKIIFLLNFLYEKNFFFSKKSFYPQFFYRFFFQFLFICILKSGLRPHTPFLPNKEALDIGREGEYGLDGKYGLDGGYVLDGKYGLDGGYVLDGGIESRRGGVAPSP